MDKRIKEKLEELAPSYHTEHWEKLAKMLDAEDASMDNPIKEKLDAHKPAMPANAWASFKAFEERSTSDQFDQSVRDKLEQVRTGEVKGWTQLEQKWEGWQKMRKEFVSLRIIEVFVILLLLFSLHQWGSLWTDSLNKASVFVLAETSDESIDKKPQAWEQGDFDATSAGTESTSLSSKVQVDQPGPMADSENKKVDTQADRQGRNTQISDEANLTSTPSTNKPTDTHSEWGKANARQSSVGPLHSTLEDDGNHVPTHYPAKLNHFGILEHLDRIGDRIAWQSDIPLPSKVRKSTYYAGVESSRSPIWLSVYGTIGNNYVTQPAQDHFKASRYNQFFSGGGIQLSFEHGRWFLSSGLEYHESTLISGRTINHIDDQNTLYFVTLNETNIKFITLPILLRYNIVHQPKHRFYALAGARLHMSSDINYNFTVEEGPGPSSSGEPIDEMAIHGVSDVNFNYLTINAGVGYQYMITPRLGVFSSISTELFGQNHSLFPNAEKLNVLRGDFGVRLRLK